MGWHAHPTEIRFVEDELLLDVTFSDDEEREYDTRILRGYCPCAHCQGHTPRPLNWNPPGARNQVIIADISQVGNYAMCIAWADGHNTGVYAFDLLRQFADEPEEVLQSLKTADEHGRGEQSQAGLHAPRAVLIPPGRRQL